MSTLTQINIFSTVFGQIIENYDEGIKNIRVFGVLAEDNTCKHPYFMAKDVFNYLEQRPERCINKFKKPKELIQIQESQHIL